MKKIAIIVTLLVLSVNALSCSLHGGSFMMFDLDSIQDLPSGPVNNFEINLEDLENTPEVESTKVSSSAEEAPLIKGILKLKELINKK